MNLVRTESVRLNIILHGEAVIKQKPMITLSSVAIVDLCATGNVLQSDLVDVHVCIYVCMYV